MNKKFTKGFTLVELLVIIVIIGVLAALFIPSYSKARLSAKDAAVAVALSSFRTEVEMEYNGVYDNICEGDLYTQIETTVEGYGGMIAECTELPFNYRVVVILPSAVAAVATSTLELIPTAYAQSGGAGQGTVIPPRQGVVITPEPGQGTIVPGAGDYVPLLRVPNNKQFDAYCVNSQGIASLIALDNVPNLNTSNIESYIGSVRINSSEVGTGIQSGVLLMMNKLVKTAFAQGTTAVQTKDYFCSYEEKSSALNVTVAELRSVEASVRVGTTPGQESGDVGIISRP